MGRSKKMYKKVVAAVLTAAMVITSATVPAGKAEAAKKLALNKKKATIKVKKTVKLKVKNAPKKAKVTWSVKKKTVASVTKKGVVKGKKAGKTYVIAKVVYKKGKKKITKKLKCLVTVKKAATAASASPAASTETSASPSASAEASPAASADASASPAASADASPAASAEVSESPSATAAVSPKENNSKALEGGAVIGENTGEIDIPENPKTFTDYNAKAITKELGTAWNLGNTHDALNYVNNATGETMWQNIITTKAFIKHLKEIGFSTLRLPVSWGDAMNDDGTVNEYKIGRVQEITDYAIDEGMYVIINMHWDCESATPTFNNFLKIAKIKDADDLTDPMYVKYGKIWRSIAERFKNYDEHLILESLNELYQTDYDEETGETKNWGWASEDAPGEMTKIMNLNQIFVNNVRATGSNNANRWLLVPSKNASASRAIDESFGFEMPKDTLESPRLMISFHNYGDYTENSLSDEVEAMDDSTFKLTASTFRKKYLNKGYPIIVGEYGIRAMANGSWAYDTDTGYNASIDLTYEGFNAVCKEYGLVPVLWDNGATGTDRIVDRTLSGNSRQQILNAVMKGYYSDSIDTIPDYATYVPDPTAYKNLVEGYGVASKITLSKEETTVALGSRTLLSAKMDTTTEGDVILWKSEDATIAVMDANRKIWARSPGTTTLTAYSMRNPSVTASIKVTVEPDTPETAVTDIVTDYAEYTIAYGYPGYLNGFAIDGTTELKGDDAYDITYKSSDPSLVTVSGQGRLVVPGAIKSTDGKEELVDPNKTGTATITMTTGSGFTKDIKVNVVAASDLNIPSDDTKYPLKLRLNLLYNSDTYQFFSTEHGDSITVSEDGEYTVSFDASADLSKSAQRAGIDAITEVGSIYIADTSSTKSYYENAKLVYTSIKIDGTELTLNDKNVEFFPYKGTSFDTGNPFNVWEFDTNVCDDVSVGTFEETGGLYLDFSKIAEKPVKMEVSFKLTGLN
ncbi:MAG: glycoside hydrolase family 5 protein [Lachnospiraceae bacterium]|nr:glycoside hydrolase family 5 protein [Lachnospiraceae bacterium]